MPTDTMIIKREPMTENLHLRLSESEKEKIKTLADKHARGDVSAWVRFAALNYSPDKK